MDQNDPTFVTQNRKAKSTIVSQIAKIVRKPAIVSGV